MIKNDVTDNGIGFTKLVDRINLLFTDRPSDFTSESNKIRFLRSAELSH